MHAPIVRWRDGNTDGDLEDEGDSTLYYCTDANFNVTALVNTSGTAVERYLYDPYGKVTVCDGSWTPREGNASAYSNEVLFRGSIPILPPPCHRKTFRFSPVFSVPQFRIRQRLPLSSESAASIGD